MSTLRLHAVRGAASIGLMVLVLAMGACSSGSGGTVTDVVVTPDVGDTMEGDSGPVLTPKEASAKVVLPEGVKWPTAGLRVVTGFDEEAVGGDGGVRVTVGGEGDSLAAVLDAEGNLVLFGFIDPAETRTLDLHSTATAMLWLSFNLYALPPEGRVETLRLLEAHKYTAQLARAIGYELVDSPRALTEPNEAILGELENTMKLIVNFPLEDERDTQGAPATGDEANNASVLVEPSEVQSGVLVGPNLGGNGLQVTNMSRRTAWYYVYRTGFENEDGQETKVSPPELVKQGFVQSTSGISGTVGTLYQAFTGGLDFGPKVLDPVALNVPDGQRRVFFETIVAGAHLPFKSKTPSWYDGSNATHLGWRVRAELMTTVSFVRDVLTPAVFSLVMPIKGAVQGTEDFPTWESLAQLVASQVPAVGVQLAEGDFRGALQTVLLAMANNYELRNAVAFAVLHTVTDGFSGGADKLMDKVIHANFYVAAADLAVAAADIALVVSDLSDADALERWKVTAVRAKVLATADRPKLDPGHLDTVLTASVPGSEPTDRFCFVWELNGPGELSPFLPGPATGSDKVQVTGDPDMLYLIDASDLVDGALALMTVKAYVNPNPSGEGCTYPPTGELVGEGRVAIESQTDELLPCPAESFDLAYWQNEAGGLGLTAVGGYGGKVTATVTIPPDPEISGGYRDVSIYIPRPANATKDAVTVSGDVAWVSSVKKETWMQDIRRDEVPGPIMFYGIADIRVHAVGTITVSMGTTEAPVDCDTEAPGSPPCCPHWIVDSRVGNVLVGPFVFAESYGVGRTVDLIAPN